ncbi:hypothetical protein IW22_10150 [Chryseobacterium sp. JM1]|nr:hypothetical protein IW22_10150 [Chryseobacterium sp. JM1]
MFGVNITIYDNVGILFIRKQILPLRDVLLNMILEISSDTNDHYLISTLYFYAFHIKDKASASFFEADALLLPNRLKVLYID